MHGIWANYQSAFQLVVGANLAIAALPPLGQPALDAERRRWESLLRLASIEHERHAEVRAGMVEFAAARRELERQVDSVRKACWWLATAATGVLLFATYFADSEVNIFIATVTIVVGALPALVLVGLNRRARNRLGASSGARRGLEKAMGG